MLCYCYCACNALSRLSDQDWSIHRDREVHHLCTCINEQCTQPGAGTMASSPWWKKLVEKPVDLAQAFQRSADARRDLTL